MDILWKRPDKDWEAFLKCLRADGQIDLADHLSRSDLVSMQDTSEDKVLQHSGLILRRMKPTLSLLWKLREKEIIDVHEHQILNVSDYLISKGG